EGLRINLEKTRRSARQSLELCSVSLDGQAPPAFDSGFTAEEKADLLDGCYELLLVLADAEAPAVQPSKEAQLRQALQALDRAPRRGPRSPPSHAYPPRRARYLNLLGEAAAARREEDEARRQPPATALDHYLVGDLLYREGKVAEAVPEFE